MLKSLIVASMLAFALAGCNKSGNSSPSAPASSSGSTSSSPPAGLSQLGGAPHK
jgi:hypothetical protein